MTEPHKGRLRRGELVESGGALANALLALLDLEIESLRGEMTLQFTQTKKVLAILLGAFSLGLGGALLLSFAAVEALAAVSGMARWSAFAAVAGLFLILAGGIGYRALSLARSVDFIPQKTLASLREDIQCLRTH